MARIYLIGARASGKTTVGSRLSSLLACEFVDLDHFLCASAGKNVEEIVEQDGWEHFRKLESQALREASGKYRGEGHLVIATGGGVVLAPENRSFLQGMGHVFWLRAGAPTLASRLGQDPKSAQRPSLTGKPPIEEVQEILRQRADLYQSCAHAILDAEQGLDRICQQALDYLREKDLPLKA